jgi:hypothetical protein
MDQPLIAVEANRFHREAGSGRYITDFEEPCLYHLTLLQGEKSS